MKKRISFCLILTLLAGMITLSSSSCSRYGPAPEIDQVYDRIVEVIEASHEVNVLLFGAGLPTYPRGNDEDQLIHRYYSMRDESLVYVTPYAKYATIEEMKAAIEKIYSKEYRESLFEANFTGYADADMTVSMPAKYSTDDRALYQNVYVDPLVTGTRVYDFAAMKIADGSNGKYIRVEIPSYPENSPGEWTVTGLTFVYEEGNWYLDSPSC